MVPSFMAPHTGHEWFLVSPKDAGDDLVLTLSPMTAPERLATVRVNAGAEAFFIDFCGHSTAEFAYDDEGRAETLQEQIDLAVAATLGPTRITLNVDGDVIVGSILVIDPDGSHPRQNGPVSWPL